MIHFQFSFSTVFVYVCVYSMWHVNSVFARLGLETLRVCVCVCVCVCEEGWDQVSVIDDVSSLM